MTNKDINYIIKNVLGYKIEWEDSPQGWDNFVETHFTRAGIVNEGKPDEITYTPQQNRYISTVAMLQTIDQIRKRLFEINTEG